MFILSSKWQNTIIDIEDFQSYYDARYVHVFVGFFAFKNTFVLFEILNANQSKKVNNINTL